MALIPLLLLFGSENQYGQQVAIFKVEHQEFGSTTSQQLHCMIPMGGRFATSLFYVDLKVNPMSARLES